MKSLLYNAVNFTSCMRSQTIPTHVIDLYPHIGNISLVRVFAVDNKNIWKLPRVWREINRMLVFYVTLLFKNWTFYKFYVTFCGNAVEICSVWLVPLMASDDTSPVTLKIHCQPQKKRIRESCSQNKLGYVV